MAAAFEISVSKSYSRSYAVLQVRCRVLICGEAGVICWQTLVPWPVPCRRATLFYSRHATGDCLPLGLQAFCYQYGTWMIPTVESKDSDCGECASGDTAEQLDRSPKKPQLPICKAICFDPTIIGIRWAHIAAVDSQLARLRTHTDPTATPACSQC